MIYFNGAADSFVHTAKFLGWKTKWDNGLPWSNPVSGEKYGRRKLCELASKSFPTSEWTR